MTRADFPEFAWVWVKGQNLGLPRHQVRIARWLAANWREGRRDLLLLAFRASGKSTVVGLFCAWALACNPDLRIMVLAADMALAKKMVRNVKRIIERHPLTRGLRPARRDQWAADQFTVARPGELRDPSMIAKGVAGNITGSRAELVICDDVEVPNTCDTAPKRADLRARLAEIEFVLVPGGTQLYVGTPHTYYTLYADAPRAEVGETRPFLDGFRRLELPLVDGQGASAWPERYPPERIAQMRRRSGPARFDSQMLLRPVNIADGRLDPERMRPYGDELTYAEAQGQPVLSLGGRRMAGAAAWWDPAYGGTAGGDSSVVAAVFTDAEGGYWLHRVLYLKGGGAEDGDEASAACRQVARFVADLHLPALHLETNGLGRFLPGLLRRELAAQAVGCAVVEAHSTRPKALRIVEAFDALLAAGALHAHRSVWSTPFVAEMREWRPGGKRHDDGLDAVAGCLTIQPVRLGGAPPVPRRPDWRPATRAVAADADFTP